MEIKEAILKLDEASGNYSKMWAAIYQAIDDIAEYLKSRYPTKSVWVSLPGRYSFCHWPNGQYEIIKSKDSKIDDIEIDVRGGNDYPLSRNKMEHLIAFCGDVDLKLFSDI
jgi:hypothetical protein